MDTARTFTPRAAAAVIAGLVVAAIVVGVALSGGDGETFDSTSEAEPSAPETTSTGSPASPPAQNEGLDVPAVDCSPLLTLAEVDEALGVDIDAGDSGSIEIARGENCFEPLVDDDSVFVSIGPGSAADFITAAQLLGVPGQPVADVGHEAIWFEGADVSVLSVRAGTELGLLHYRITLGRPDLDGSAQLEIATELALSALMRFPGVRVIAPEPVEILLEAEPVDLSGLSYVHNLLAKVQDGEWTHGEGLVSTLQLFVGEVAASDVIRNTELADRSGTAVIELAHEYLDTSPEQESSAEISRLLDLLVISGEELDDIRALIAASASAENADVGEGESALPPVADRGFQLASQTVTAQETEDQETEESDVGCPPWFGIGCSQDLVDPELDVYGAEKYRLVGPNTAEGNTAGWTDDHITWTLAAMRDSAQSYEPLGSMPNVSIMLTPFEGVDASTDTYDASDCSISLNTGLQVHDEAGFKQSVALEMAHCLISGTFTSPPSWWQGGLAIYLSGVVYPSANAEHLELPELLASVELDTTLLQLSYTNWIFFEYAHQFLDTEGIFDLVNSLPPLSAVSGIEDRFHKFKQSLTDETIPDLGPGTVPIVPEAWDVPIEEGNNVTVTAAPFGTYRLWATVAPGMKACVSFSPGQLTASWRSGTPRNPSSDWKDPPDELTGDSVFLITTTKAPGNYVITVKKVVETSKECEEDPDSGDDEECDIQIRCDPSGFYLVVPGYGELRVIEVPGS